MKFLGIKSKLLVMLLGVSLGSIVTVAYLAFRSGNQALTESVFERLTSMRAAKARQIESYLEGVEGQVRVLGRDHMVARAAVRFRETFDELAQETIPAEWDESLDAFYRDEFLPRLQQNVEGSPVFEAYRPSHPATRYLQYHYMAANPNPAGEKERLDDPGDGSAYSRVHARYHEIFRDLVEQFGYYDMFLLDPDTGVVVYSVFKESDFATSLRDGPYSNTNLAALVQKVRETPDPGFVRLIDFARYRPSYSAPAAFVATSVYEGTRLVGILAFQLPVGEINHIMTGNGGWQVDGLGATGETYLVGPDYRMRSVSRFLIDDPEGYARALRTSGVPDSTVERILRLKTSILEQEVRSEAATQAMQGTSGTGIVDDYRGVPVLSSYAPLDIPDVSWVILSEIDQAEAYAPIADFERQLIVSAVILMFVVTLLAMLLASSFVRPIRTLSEGARRVSEGETGFRIESASRDEFGELAESFNRMVASVDAQSARVEETNRENEALLAQILPKRVVKRLKAGEESIADAHESATVLFSDLVGFTQLARSVSPKESVAMLNDLVSSFDEAAEQHGVEKIKTIGDGYMAASGLSGSRLDHDKRALDLACDMLGIVRRFNNERGLALELRIGVNSGPVVAGVIGRDKFLYDLWGATVNRASNMKTEAAPGEVLVTAAVAEAVKGLYEFEPRGTDAFVLRADRDAARGLRRMSEILGQTWFRWAAALVVGFPLLAVALGEVADRLARRGQPLAAVARALRNLVLPVAVLLAFVTQVLGFAAETITARVAQTALWIALLYTTLTALNVFLFEHAESTSWRARAPRLFVDLLRLLLVFVGAALVLSIVWERNLGGLLAALGVGSIVLGLALQDTLGSLMSGIALLFERPFQIGDWIKVAGNEGEVIEVNWRSVHLRTRERDLLVVPNSILAKETIVNTRAPTSLHAERIPIAFALDAPPNRVREVLTQVAASLPDVLSEPSPKVEVMEFAEDRIRYEAKLYLTHLRGIPKMRSEFATRAWYAAQRAGLALPVPVRNVQAAETDTAAESARVADTLTALTGFASLGESARKTLTEGARLLHYAAGEAALAQGERSGALCVVSDGRARMTLRTKAGDEREVMELRPGDTFGEGALLKEERSPVTVTASSDLSVVALDTAALESVIEDSSALASEIGQLVEIRRRAARRVKHASAVDGEPEAPASRSPASAAARSSSG